MRVTVTLNTFRKVARLEEQMMRGMMPRTSEADPQAVPFMADVVNTRRSERTLTVKLQEVANV